MITLRGFENQTNRKKEHNDNEVQMNFDLYPAGPVPILVLLTGFY
jgi:hypothetical protein